MSKDDDLNGLEQLQLALVQWQKLAMESGEKVLSFRVANDVGFGDRHAVAQ